MQNAAAFLRDVKAAALDTLLVKDVRLVAPTPAAAPPSVAFSAASVVAGCALRVLIVVVIKIFFTSMQIKLRVRGALT